MTHREQERTIAHLQSIATLSVELQTALRDRNDAKALDLWDTIADDYAAAKRKMDAFAAEGAT